MTWSWGSFFGWLILCFITGLLVLPVINKEVAEKYGPGADYRNRPVKTMVLSMIGSGIAAAMMTAMAQLF